MKGSCSEDQRQKVTRPPPQTAGARMPKTSADQGRLLYCAAVEGRDPTHIPNIHALKVFSCSQQTVCPWGGLGEEELRRTGCKLTEGHRSPWVSGKWRHKAFPKQTTQDPE